MSVIENIVTTLSNKVIDLIAKKYDESAFKSKSDAKKHLEVKFREVFQWSSGIEMFDLGKKLDLFEYTISLSMTNSPRKLAKMQKESSFSSEALVNIESNILLLGAPGSGKTTTLKRVCQQILNIDRKTFNTPVLFRLRMVDTSYSLYQLIAEYLGLDYSVEEKTRKLFLNKKPISYAIIQILDLIDTCIIFDGLDEINIDRQAKLMGEISELANSLKESKILVTSRSGGYNSLLSGFSVFEIEPLNDIQVKSICSMWLDNPAEFINKLENLPYKDTLNRPLSLINTLIIYKSRGYLPERPVVIYEMLIDLFLEKWDRENTVIRLSKYADFFPKEKFKFLAELSYYLLYKMGPPLISFNRQQLISIFQLIHKRYHLPANEANEVVREIESHNGILVENYGNVFQFSHLTYQEYLAAVYIVNNPVIEEARDYIISRPGPVAVALAIASNPNNWIDELFLEANLQQRLKHADSAVAEFLKRLYIEKPGFNESGITGFAFLNIAFAFNDNWEILDALSKLKSIEVIGLSMERALAVYSKKEIANDYYEFELQRSSKISEKFSAPVKGSLKKVFADTILN